MANWTLGRVKATVRSKLDDTNITYTDDDFLNPKVQEAYECYTSELSSTNSEYDIGVVEVPMIPAGTPNLASYQVAGQPLAGLVNPIRIDWKLTGLIPAYYQLLEGPKDVLPDLIPQNYMAAWEWRQNVIWLTQSTVVCDIRIRGEYDPAALTSDDSVLALHPRIGFAVACRVASDVAKVRGNAQWAKDYSDEAEEAIDFIMVQLVKQDQGKVRRVGRQTQRQGGYVGPNANPQ